MDSAHRHVTLTWSCLGSRDTAGHGVPKFCSSSFTGFVF